MSVVTSIRDYVEILNTQVGAREDPVSTFSLVFETFPQIFKMCQDTLWYFFSFKGLRENFYQLYLGGRTTLEDNSIKLFLENGFNTGSNLGLSVMPTIPGAPDMHADTNFVIPSYEDLISSVTNKNLSFFFFGFGNSFFISLPGSIGTLIILRRVILQGIPAGYASTMGSVFGSCFIMLFATIGSRFIILSPVFLDIAFYISLLIPGYIILRAICFSYFRIIPKNDINSLLSIGFVHFLLGISNQSTLFKHIRDLTIAPYPTRFLGIYSINLQIMYVLGFIIGNVIFAFTIFSVIVFAVNWWLTRSIMSRSKLMNLSENTSIVLLTALSISTISYYGTDFLLTKSFGFLPVDKTFSETVLTPNTLFKDPHNLTGVHALYPSNEFSLDPAPFDRPLEKLYRRCILLKQPTFKYRSFEELNYQGEKHWLHRGFRHGSAKPIKTVTLPAEKNKLARGRALLRSLDKAIGWADDDQKSQNNLQLTFTNLAKEEIEFNFLPPSKGLLYNTDYAKDLRFLEKKFKRLFFGQIGLLPGRLPPIPYGPFDSQEMAHKRLAFTNPVYKALLSFDIDFFLKRQPPNQSLSTKDEHNIFLKRQLLERYINTQRDYFDNLSHGSGVKQPSMANWSLPERQSTANLSDRATELESKPILVSHEKNPQFGLLPPSNEPQNFVKSLANQTYKHQFKGTLEIVRQMFAVSLDCPDPSSLAGGGAWEKLMKEGENFFKDDKGITTPRPKNPRVLKFDQPLYNHNRKEALNIALAKQLQSTTKEQFKLSTSATTNNQENRQNNKVVDRTVTPLALLLEQEKQDALDYSFLGHEELYGQTTKHSIKQSLGEDPTLITKGYQSNHNNVTARHYPQEHQKPFLESTSISPFYIGWDNSRRQLFLTQRYLARKQALDFNLNQNDIITWSENPKKEQGNAYKATQNNLKLEKPIAKSAIFTTWPILKPDPTDLAPTNWRIPSRSFEHMLALEEESRMGLDEPSDKNKGLRGSYENFVQLWNSFFPHLSQKSSFKLSRWPTNITTPAVQTDLESFEEIEKSLFTGIKRGGFIWPGSTPLKFFKN